jgi:hypothetical protein
MRTVHVMSAARCACRVAFQALSTVSQEHAGLRCAITRLTSIRNFIYLRQDKLVYFSGCHGIHTYAWLIGHHNAPPVLSKYT